MLAMNLDEQTRTDENRARRQGQQEDLESPQVARLAAGSLVKVQHLRAALRGPRPWPPFFTRMLRRSIGFLMGYHRISMEEFHHKIKDPQLFGHQIWFHPHGWYFGRAELSQCSSCVCVWGKSFKTAMKYGKKTDQPSTFDITGFKIDP